MKNLHESLLQLSSLEARAAELQEEIAELRESLKKSEIPSLLPSQCDFERYSIVNTAGQFSVEGRLAMGSCGQNYFSTSEQAAAYADAFETLILLRRQPGTEKPADRTRQWVIESDGTVYSWDGNYYKKRCWSPCFDTQEHAKQAIKTIGSDRIKRMMNTLHHVDEAMTFEEPMQ